MTNGGVSPTAIDWAQDPDVLARARSLREALVERQRASVEVHREIARGSGFPPPKAGGRPTFLHGFLLPFSLLVATLRDRALGHAYLKLICARAVAVGVVAALAFAASDGPEDLQPKGARIAITPSAPGSAPLKLHKHAPGVDVDIDEITGEKKVSVLGVDVPVVDAKSAKPNAKPNAKPKRRAAAVAPARAAAPAPADAEDGAEADEPPAESGWLDDVRVVDLLKREWTWLAWFLGVLSTVEGILVFFTRRYDDWISFHASSLARIRPEEHAPKPPRLTFEPKWIVKKLKRRIRGYIVLAAGIPFLMLFRLVPVAGDALFAVGLTLWSWYWLTVFTAAKSAHAWADEHVAPSPYLIRELRDRPPRTAWLAPLRWYTNLWARLTRGLNAPATTFERAPAPFLGLALARVILALPGIYLVARPIIPVAAGRLCAEVDPWDRFSQNA